MPEQDDSCWRLMIEELQRIGVGLAKIGEHVGVTERQVSEWKRGERPKGMRAIKLYLLHGKHFPQGRT